MIAIKDMEMPSSCAECPMTYKDEVDYRICAIIGKNIDYGNANKIHPDCPLVEIVTCNDCKHYKKDLAESIGYPWCAKNSCRTSEDYYCGGGEFKVSGSPNIKLEEDVPYNERRE